MRSPVLSITRSILGQPWRWRGGNGDGRDPGYRPDDLVTQLLLARGCPRDAVEAHLADCRACSVRFFSLKRAVEVPEADALPSQRARTRLRAAVEQELGLSTPLWERALAFWVAAGAVACAVLLVR